MTVSVRYKCSICLGNWPQELIRILSCGHTGCVRCFKEHLQRNREEPTCPHCREPIDVEDPNDFQRFYVQPVICGLEVGSGDIDASQAEVVPDSDSPFIDLSDELVEKINAFSSGLVNIDPRADVTSGHLTRTAADAAELASAFKEEGHSTQETLLRALHRLHVRVASVLKDAEGRRTALTAQKTLVTTLQRENAKLKNDVNSSAEKADHCLQAAEDTTTQLITLRERIQPLKDREKKLTAELRRAEMRIVEEAEDLKSWKAKVASFKARETVHKEKIKELREQLQIRERAAASEYVAETPTRKRPRIKEDAFQDKENVVLDEESQSLIVLPADMSYSTANDMNILSRDLLDNVRIAAPRSPPPPSPPIYRPTFGQDSQRSLLGKKAARSAGNVQAFKVSLMREKRKVLRKTESAGYPLDLVDGRPTKPIATGPIKSRRLHPS